MLRKPKQNLFVGTRAEILEKLSRWFFEGIEDKIKNSSEIF